MGEEVWLYPALEDAVRSGAQLECYPETARGGVVRVAFLFREKVGLAAGLGVTLREALAAAEQDLLAGGAVAAEFADGQCPTCALDRLDPAGSREVDSALDAHLRDRLGFRVAWSDGQFRFIAEWRRRAWPPHEVVQQLIAGGVPTRWQHGEHVWDIVPSRSRKTGEWWFARAESVSRPPGSKEACPQEKRRVDAAGPSLAAALSAAEGLLAAARREDEQWHRLTVRQMNPAEDTP